MTNSTRKIALFGATGRTGREVVKTLFSQEYPPYSFHILVRNAAKLEALIPEINSRPNVEITEGSLTDKSAVMNCLRNASLIISTIGDNNNVPGMRVFENTALAITAALAELQAEAGSSWSRPHLTVLTSASTNLTFVAQRPRFLEWLLAHAFNHVYHDLKVGEHIFSSFPSLMTTTFVHAPLIVEGERTGFKISADSEGACVCYQDLGEAMGMLATDPHAIEIHQTGVQSTGNLLSLFQMLQILVINVMGGLLGRYVPGYWTIRAMVIAIFLGSS